MKKSNNNAFAILIIVIVIIIILYIISLGKIKSANASIGPEEFREEKEKAIRRHTKLKALIEKQEELKNKLSKISNRVYLGVRIFLSGLWGMAIILLSSYNIINSLDDFLNWNELFLFIIIGIMFLTFGTIESIKTPVRFLKIRTENWVCSKYLNIDERIEANKAELKILDDKLKK